MFGKVKRLLGIEGVKLEIEIPHEISSKEDSIKGKLKFSSMTPQEVKSVKVLLKERYSRGRRKNKLIDEYVLGSIEMETNLEIPKDEIVEIEFELPFAKAKSQIDDLEDRYFLLKAPVKIAKLIKNVKSRYRVEAEAKVSGTALHPFAQKEIIIK